MTTEKLTVDEGITWFAKNKKWIWPTLTFIIALLGGNMDRVGDLLPTVGDTSKLEADIESLKTVVAGHEARLEKCKCDQNSEPTFRE